MVHINYELSMVDMINYQHEPSADRMLNSADFPYPFRVVHPRASSSD